MPGKMTRMIFVNNVACPKCGTKFTAFFREEELPTRRAAPPGDAEAGLREDGIWLKAKCPCGENAVLAILTERMLGCTVLGEFENLYEKALCQSPPLAGSEGWTAWGRGTRNEENGRAARRDREPGN